MPTARKMTWGALWILPLLLAPAAFLAAVPWLKTISQSSAIGLTVALVIFVLSYSNYLAYRHQRGLDEVQKAGGAFAAQWGAPAGQAAFALLLVLPPFQDVATTIVSRFAADSGATVKGTVVVFALALGFIAVVMLQTIGTVIVHTLWWTDKR